MRQNRIVMQRIEEMAHMGVWELDLATWKITWSDEVYRIFGVFPRQFEPDYTSFIESVHPEDRAAVAQAYMASLKTENDGYEIDHRVVRRQTGEIRYVHEKCIHLRDSTGRIVRSVGMVQDLTERQTAHARIVREQERFQKMINLVPDMISIHDPHMNIVYSNWNGFAALPQEKRILGTKCYATYRGLPAICPDCQAKAVIDSRRSFQMDVALPEGIWVDLRVIPLLDQEGNVELFMEWVRDITDRKRAEAEKEKLQHQLLQAQKFEAIGTLGGGIAHDFNNLLMGLQGRASLMKLDLNPGHPHLEHIEAIETYIQNAADLTRQLLGLARGGKYEVRPTDLNQLVLESAAMFGRTKKEIRIHTDLNKTALVAEVDRKQIAQVLLNMYINAWQAMPDGGEIFLQTRMVAFDESARLLETHPPGAYGQIAITDTGIGMAEVTRRKIFDPFFTTKAKGRGTGLGLASAYGIIHNHGGMITVYSEVGHGATFNIYLPLSQQEIYREAATESGMIQGTETVLLVDDEQMIVDVGRAMLDKLGYRVIVANGGEQAVEMVANAKNHIDLVILDLIMPSMDGGKTFDEIRKIRPAVAVILSSGYAINGQADTIMRRGCNGFIQKPFNMHELSRKIREVLDPMR